MSKHVFEISWNDTATPDWTFDGVDKPATMHVEPGETIHFNFFPNLAIGNTLFQAVLMSGKEKAGENASPFNRPFPLVLGSDNLLTVGTVKGLWGFCIVFSVSDAANSTRFFFVPDPELQIGSRP